MIMFDDELDPITKTPRVKNLEPMSISELEAYIQLMTTEIKRVQEDIEKKKAHQDAVSSLFKS